MNLIIQILLILVYVAVIYLILYLFTKWVTPVDQKIINVILFILAALLIIYAITGHTLLFWRQ